MPALVEQPQPRQSPVPSSCEETAQNSCDGEDPSHHGAEDDEFRFAS